MRTLLAAILVGPACASPPSPVGSSTPNSPVGSASERPEGLAGLVMTLDGKQYPITGDRFVIGGEGADVPLAGGDCQLTARVAVVKDPKGYRLKDLESKGFLFNKSKMDNKIIEDQDLFELCNTTLVFSLK